MPSKIPQLGVRLDPALVNKLRFVAANSGRSMAKEIEQLVKVRIKDYEQKYGEIVIHDEEISRSALNDLDD